MKTGRYKARLIKHVTKHMLKALKLERKMSWVFLLDYAPIRILKKVAAWTAGYEAGQEAAHGCVLAETRSDRRCLVKRAGFGVRGC
jgi:hypothetical protein